MVDSLKQRLIGAVLLLAAVIAVAIFLVNNANDTIEQPVETIQPDFVSSVSSEQPEIATVEPEVLLDPQKLEPIPDTAKTVAIQPSQKVAVKQEEKTKPEVKESVKVAKKKIESSVATNRTQWLVQLASFSKKSNAQALQDKVSKLGFKAHIETVTKNSNTNYRVRIGPESDRSQVDKIVKVVSQSLSLTPQVLTVKP